MILLSVESSCDETAVALVQDGRTVLADCSASSVEMHKIYGGVVPEIASRKHVQAIAALTDKALADAGLTKKDIDAVAVTYAPGLIGAVLVGVSFAKSAAYALGVPLIPVHHVRGHIAANYLAFPELEPPFVALAISGGNTLIVDVADYTDMTVLGATRDDAAGECFDKAARVLGLPYPGGRPMDQLAQQSAGGLNVLAPRSADGGLYSLRRQRVAEADHRLVVGREEGRSGDFVEPDQVYAALDAVQQAAQADEHVVGQDGGVGHDAALHGRMADVALVPQGNVVKGDLSVGLHDARQSADLLHGDGVALVRHGGAALLALAERLLGLERIGLLQVADLGRDALAGGRCSGKHAGKVGVVIAADDLRGQRIVDQAQVLADVLLDERFDGAVGADVTGDGTEGNVLASVLKTIEVALEFPCPRAKLHTKGHRLGMDAMGAAGAERIALLEGTTLADYAKLLDVLDNQVARLSKLIAQSRIAQVGAGHTVVNPAARLGLDLGNIGVDIFLHVGQEGDDIVARDLLDLVNLRLLKVGVVANPLGLFFGNTDLAELRLSLAGQDLNLLPNGVLVLEGEDVSHLRAGIAIDHSGSFLVIGTLVVTQPLYRARVRVWAAGINLTFWNWSGQKMGCGVTAASGNSSVN